MTDYFAWIDRRTRPRRRQEPETEQRVTAPEPVAVHEHNASTTIVRQIREALRERFSRP